MNSKFTPHIGKNVIETLTLGMYEDPRFIYREYVQNAADQIDIAVEDRILESKNDGEINIIVDSENRKIIIEDNATGIKRENALQFLGDVANSQKDREKRKGFRGIGRLGGLGYCEKLIFETSYKGENQSSKISLNAKLLKKIIEDKTDTSDASTVISVITSIEQLNTTSDSHYFKVILEGVSNDDLLDEVKVFQYLSIVAPIPFSANFPFASKIYKFFKKKNIRLEEYDVHLNLNENKLQKPYKTLVHSKTGYKDVNIFDIDFIEINDKEGNLIAIGWYGLSSLLNNIIHQDDFERGIRIRNNNIQIGSENTLNQFFKEDRFNHHFVGEIHTFGSEFKPNARRDFFNENPTVLHFQSELRKVFTDLHSLSHAASDVHSSLQKIEDFKKEKDKFENTVFKSKSAEVKKKKELESKKKNIESATKKINKVAKKATENKAVQKVFEYRINKQNISEIDTTIANKNRSYTLPKLSKLKKSQKQVVYEIFEIIENELLVNEAEELKEIIAAHYE